MKNHLWHIVGNPWPDAFMHNLLGAAWQGAILLLLVFVVCRLFPRLPLNTRRALWFLACLRMAVAPFWMTPVTLLPPAAPALVRSVPLSAIQTGAPRTSPAPENASRPIAGSVESLPATASPRSETARSTQARSGQPRLERPQRGATWGAITGATVDSGFRAPVTRPQSLYVTTAFWSLWLTGVGWHLYRAFRRVRAVQRLLRTARPLASPEIEKEAQEIAVRLGQRHLPQLQISPEVQSPLVLRPLRPTVLLPADFEVRYTSEERAMMLAHEMAHLRRQDLWLGLVPLLAQACFWFVPPVFWASRQWAITREAVCDADALRVTGASSAAYALLLLKVVTPPRSRTPLAALGLGEGYRTLKQRLELMAHPSRIANANRYRPLLAAFGVAAVVPWRLTGPPKSILEVYTPPVSERTRRITFTTPGIPYSVTDLTLAFHLNSARGSTGDGYLTRLDDRGQASGFRTVFCNPGENPTLEIFRTNGDAVQAFALPSNVANANVIGVTSTSDIVGTLDFDRQRPRAFRIRDGVVSELGTLGGQRSVAADVNVRGLIVGMADTPQGHSHAVLYQEGRIVDLGTLGGKRSGATAINTRGEIAGWSETASGRIQPFLYYNGKMKRIGVGLSALRKITITDINDRGDIIGQIETLSGVSHGFFGRIGHSREFLSHAGPQFQTNCVSLNARGQVIGTMQLFNGESRAFVYQDGKQSDLTELIPAESQWALEYVLDINHFGQILGMGHRGGALRAFLLTPNP